MPDTFAGALLQAELDNPAIRIVAHLAKNPIALDAESIALEDFVECDFIGYEPMPLEDAAVDVFAEENYAEAFYREVEWEVTGVITPQVVYACYVTIELVNEDEERIGIVLNNVQIFETPIVLDRKDQKIVRKFSVMATSEIAA